MTCCQLKSLWLVYRDILKSPVTIWSMEESHLQCVLTTLRFIKHNETDMHFLCLLISAFRISILK